MARYVLPVAGAVIGGIYGGPQGAALGWSIGAAIGGVVDPIRLPDAEGPRLQDLKAMTSTYGTVIPKGWGTVRQAGQVMWALPIKEVRREEEVGGKGGAPEQTQVTYEYFGTFAVAIGEGPIADVIRIWGDTKLVYSVYDENNRFANKTIGAAPVVDPTMNLAQLMGKAAGGTVGSFNLYKGTETQTFDPLIAADKGIDNTPAFKGLAYIVFNNIPLKDFGNRIPNISMEVAYGGTSQNVTAIFREATSPAIIDWYKVVDWTHNYVYQIGPIGGGGLHVIKYRFSTTGELTKVGELYDTSAPTPSQFSGYAISRPYVNGDIFYASDHQGADVIVRLDKEALVVKNYIAFVQMPGAQSGLKMAVVPIPTNVGTVYWVANFGFWNSVPARPCVFRIANQFAKTVVYDFNACDLDDIYPNCYGSVIPRHETVDGPPGLLAGLLTYCIPETPKADYGQIFSISAMEPGSYGAWGDVNTAWLIFELKIYATAYVNTSITKSFTLAELMGEFPSLPWTAFPVMYRFSGMLYDNEDDSIIIKVVTKDSVSSVEKTFYFKWDLEAADWAWGTETFYVPSVQDSNEFTLSDTRMYRYAYEVVSGVPNVVKVYDGRDGTLSNTIPYTGNIVGTSTFDSVSQSLVVAGAGGTPNGLAYINTAFKAGDDVSVQTIINDISERVELPAGIFTQTTAEMVKGYVLGRPVTGRSALQTLLFAKQLDIIESDFSLKVVAKTDTANGPTITEDDLVQNKNSSEGNLAETRIPEDQLPSVVTISHPDVDLDYELNTFSSKRISNATNVAIQYGQPMNIEIPVVMDSTEIKQLSETLLYGAWSERTALAYSLPMRYIGIDPTDVLTVNYADGVFTQRVSQASLGVNGQIEVDGITLAPGQYTSNADVGISLGFVPPSLVSAEGTRYFLLDTPLLRDLDDSARANDLIYHAGGGYGAFTWRGAIVSKSVNPTDYVRVTGLVQEAIWGTTVTALPYTDNPFAPDDINTLQVFITNGVLESTTLDAMLNNGSNAAAIVKSDGEIEVIQFRDVTDLGNGIYELSYIFRGRRGTDTEQHVRDHAIGDFFVLLTSGTSTSALAKTTVSLSELNALRYYKTQTAGLTADQDVITLHTAVGNTLKPYSVTNIQASWSGGDIVFTWERRSRINGEIVNYGDGSVPLNEDTEEYEMDIHAYAFTTTTIVRTKTGITGPTVTYTAAEIAADLAALTETPTQGIFVRIVQKSAQAGRGFSDLLFVRID